MAERRMFSKTIIDSDLFMDLPLEAQALYFHLSMRADDDGFIGNSKKLCRMLGVGEENLAILIEKELLIKFDSGVIAVKHWREHNQIRKDRYKATIYLEEKKSLGDEGGGLAKEENKPEKTSGNQMATKWQPNGNQMATQVRLGKDSIGKDSIGKDSLDKENECAFGTVEPCGSLISPEGDSAADAADSAPAENQTKNYFSFSSASPKADKGDVSADTPKADKGDVSADTPKADKGDTNTNRYNGAPKYQKKPQSKPRYGNFDPDEAFAAALARTEREFALMEKNESS